MQNETVAELKRLTNAVCDESASEADLARLDELLAAHSEARDYYRETLGLHSALRMQASVAGRVDLLSSTMETLPDDSVGVVSHHSRHFSWRSVMALAVASCFVGCMAGAAMLASIRNNDATTLAQSTADYSTEQANLGGEPDVQWSAQGPDGVDAIARVLRASEDCRWFIDGHRSESAERLVMPGDEVCVVTGVLELRFSSGVDMSLRAPAVLAAVSPMRARVIRGATASVVSPAAEGFTVETATAEIVDYGRVFGVGVDDENETQVVVFNGEVDLKPRVTPALTTSFAEQRLRIGEAVRVSASGRVSPLGSIVSGAFPMPGESLTERRNRGCISAITDSQLLRARAPSFYEIVHGGMREDARAFADRGYHQWNGITEAGMPEYLVGADYVRVFNNVKFNRDEDFELYLTVDKPCTIYLLVDDRVDTPEWLERDFVDTGDDIGVDEGPHRFARGTILGRGLPLKGPGKSIDEIHSIWRRTVLVPSTITCGAIDGERRDERPMFNMYGVVVAPLEANDDPI